MLLPLAIVRVLLVPVGQLCGWLCALPFSPQLQQQNLSGLMHRSSNAFLKVLWQSNHGDVGSQDALGTRILSSSEKE